MEHLRQITDILRVCMMIMTQLLVKVMMLVALMLTWLLMEAEAV